MIRLAPPPRRVPLSLRIIHLLGSRIAWAIFGFSTIFFWTFVMNADVSFATFRGPLRFAAARVTGVADTGARETKQPIYANHYQYSVAGTTFRGTSYSRTAKAVPGQTVAVEYKENDPGDSRIAGMRRAPFGPAALLLLLFPLGSLIALAYTMRKGMRRRRLLENGRLVTAVCTGRQSTNMRVNKKPVWELTFEFTTSEGMKRVVRVRTHETERLQDEAQEPLLYDPADAQAAYLLDELPSRPSIDALGELQGRPMAAALSLIVPAIVVIGNLLAIAAR